ncbi:hypothetical protein ACHAWF_016634 [Thalassiosira exigua]
MAADPLLLTGLGAALALFLTGAGASYATVHASVFAIRHKDLMAMVPVVQAGVLAVYGIIIGYKLSTKLSAEDGSAVVLEASDGYKNLCAGLSVGLSCLVSGYGMGKYLAAERGGVLLRAEGEGGRQGKRVEEVLVRDVRLVLDILGGDRFVRIDRGSVLDWLMKAW